nr:hypothetical protein BaRGS_005023 [Batillaria attramentaria]
MSAQEKKLQRDTSLSHEREKKNLSDQMNKNYKMDKEKMKKEMGQRRAQLEYEHAMLVRHHESTQDLEYKHLAALQKLKDEQLKRQHETEKENQRDYNQRAEAELRKKHALEVKQQPRSLKIFMCSQAKEIQIRKQFNEAVKTQQRQYKALKEHILQNTPKPEQKAVVKKLKEEQMRKLAALGDQWRLDESQMGEASELRNRLQQELELLMVYQSKVKEKRRPPSTNGAQGFGGAGVSATSTPRTRSSSTNSFTSQTPL